MEKERTLFIAYDDYVLKKEQTIRGIGDFIGVKALDNTAEHTTRTVGPVTSAVNLLKEEFVGLQFYQQKYCELMAEYFPAVKIDSDKLLSKYEGRLLTARPAAPNFGRTPLYLQNQIKRQTGKVKKKSKLSRLFKS